MVQNGSGVCGVSRPIGAVTARSRALCVPGGSSSAVGCASLFKVESKKQTPVPCQNGVVCDMQTTHNATGATQLDTNWTHTVFILALRSTHTLLRLHHSPSLATLGPRLSTHTLLPPAGVGAASSDLRTMQLSGVAGLVGGALSMACGECKYLQIRRGTLKIAVLATFAYEKWLWEGGRAGLIMFFERQSVSPPTQHQQASTVGKEATLSSHTLCHTHSHYHQPTYTQQQLQTTGEYISVASQKDSEEADIEKERAEQRKGPAAQQRELDELTQIYIDVSSVMCVTSQC